MQPGREGLGIYSFNLNGMFNSFGWSKVFPSLPLYSDGQIEGFSYFGFGGIVLFVLSVIQMILSILSVNRNEAKLYKKEMAALGIVVFLSCLAALSPVITFNDKLIINLQFPQFIINLWQVFRASGRIIWVALYTILVCCVILLCKRFRTEVQILAAMACLMLQIFDIQDVLVAKYNGYHSKVTYETQFSQSDFWNEIGENSKIRHIVYSDITGLDVDGMYEFTDWATDHGKTVSNFYFARSIYTQLVHNLDEALQNISAENIYIFFENNKSECRKYNLHYYEAGKYIVGYVDEVKGFKELVFR